MRSRRKLPLAAAVAGAALLLAGCGFRLAGVTHLSASLASVRVATAASEHSDFYRGLRVALEHSGTRLAEDATDPAPVLRVLEDGYSERVLTVSARNVPTAYEISYTIRVSVSSGGTELLPPESHTLTREYSFDQTALLAKEREREVLVNALASDLVDVVMHRLATL